MSMAAGSELRVPRKLEAQKKVIQNVRYVYVIITIYMFVVKHVTLNSLAYFL